MIADTTLPKVIKLLWEKILEDGDVDPCLSCRYEHLFCACSCLFLGLGELGWCNQLEPGNHRALLKSLKMCLCHPLYQHKREGEVVTSLGEVMAFSWSQHDFSSADQFVKQMLGYKQVTQSSQNKMRKQETAWWDKPCPLCCPPGACLPAGILSLQPPPVPWLREPAEVQPTFDTCHGKMSQSLRLLTMTQAQLTHVYLLRGIGAAEKRCTSDWCAKFLFACCKEKLCPLSVSSRQFLIGFFLLLTAIL